MANNFEKLVPDKFNTSEDITSVVERWTNFVEEFTEWADITEQKDAAKNLKVFKYLMGDDARRFIRNTEIPQR